MLGFGELEGVSSVSTSKIQIRIILPVGSSITFIRCQIRPVVKRCMAIRKLEKQICTQIQIQIQIHLFGHIADPGDLC